jgi:hypothetical protein
MKKPARLIVIVSLLFFTYGCAAALLGIGAGVGIGAYKYVEGSLARDYPVEYSHLWETTNTALENLQISLTSSSNEGHRGRIEGVRQDGKKVVVTLKDKGLGVTYVTVRVGMLGNRDGAARIHDEIAALEGI